MKVLLTYDTNTGSTEALAQIIAGVLLKKGIETTTKLARNVTANELSLFEGLVIGSPSWEEKGRGGQPLADIVVLMERLDPQTLVDKPVAIFGLGDKSYPQFCGAVDVMENYFFSKKTIKIIDSLKIDKYYTNSDAPSQAQIWAEELAALCLRLG